jgi:ribosomal protein S18 acetylase RimI-like enzyme
VSDLVLAPGTPHEAEAVARLHVHQLRDSHLASLGEGFLRVLYRRIARDADSTLLVARRRCDVVGFVAGTTSTRRLYREFLRHDAVRAGAVAAPGLLRHPRATLETLRYRVAVGSTVALPDAELLALVVHPAVRRHGVGARLVATLQDDFGARGVTACRVTVAADNAAALALYLRCGFVRADLIEVHRGRRSEVLVWG